MLCVCNSLSQQLVAIVNKLANMKLDLPLLTNIILDNEMWMYFYIIFAYLVWNFKESHI